MLLTDFDLKNNNSGSVMIATLMLIAILTIAVSFVMNISLTDSAISRNIRIFSNNFNKTDSIMKCETAPKIVSGWLSPSSILFDMTKSDAKVEKDLIIKIDNKVKKDLKIEGDKKEIELGKSVIQRIEEKPSPLPSGYSNPFYESKHIDLPPVYSRTSPKNFVIRKYGILATSEDKAFNGKVTMEAGYYLLFPKEK